MKTYHIAFLIFPGCQGIDVSGPFEVFAGANRWLASQGRPAFYRLSLASPGGLPVQTESGLSLNPTTAWNRLRGPLQTLIVCGGAGVDAQAADPGVVRQVQRLAQKSERVASVCTGSFLLAATGLLDGRHATTHWAFAKRFAREHPAIQVDADPIYTRDGNVWTSAGATAGIDLSLALVETDLGRDVALSIARWLVLFLRRPGTQRQFSAQLSAQLADHDPVRRVQAHVADHLHGDLSLDRLAEVAHMSTRHFARCFRREVGMTPARYILRLRLEAARRLLEEGDENLGVVAEQCGLGNTETMRRLFAQELKVSPRDYRQRFQPLKESVSQVP
ncbi:GlxA family transcriptional regulator [Dokdonella sp.]|uniref:GlxA family transcriptional regulator n=1 Tax=Dokdonella sp. TaxID=2291710 RepID=UPI003C58D806